MSTKQANETTSDVLAAEVQRLDALLIKQERVEVLEMTPEAEDFCPKTAHQRLGALWDARAALVDYLEKIKERYPPIQRGGWSLTRDVRALNREGYLPPNSYIAYTETTSGAHAPLENPRVLFAREALRRAEEVLWNHVQAYSDHTGIRHWDHWSLARALYRHGKKVEAEAEVEADDAHRIKVAVRVEGFAAHHGLPFPETEYDTWGDDVSHAALEDARTLEHELAFAGQELDTCIAEKDEEAAVRLSERIRETIASRPWLELRDIRVDDHAADDLWRLCWAPAGPSTEGLLAT